MLYHIVQSFLGKSNILELKGTVEEPVSNITCLLGNTCPSYFSIYYSVENGNKNPEKQPKSNASNEIVCEMQLHRTGRPQFIQKICVAVSESWTSGVTKYSQIRTTVTCFCTGNIQESFSLIAKLMDKGKDLRQPS